MISVELNDCVCEWELSDIEKRTINEALWIIDNKATIRNTADNFMVSKSTVGFDMLKRLPKLSIVLFDEVKTIMKKHRHWR